MTVDEHMSIFKRYHMVETIEELGYTMTQEMDDEADQVITQLIHIIHGEQPPEPPEPSCGGSRAWDRWIRWCEQKLEETGFLV